MKSLDEMIMKKKKAGKMLSPNEMKAKSSVLTDLIDDMSELDGDKLRGMKKVTVAADSDENLMKGLEKAEEVIGGEEEDTITSMMADEDVMGDMEDSEEEYAEDEMSKEELIAELARLKKKLFEVE